MNHIQKNLQNIKQKIHKTCLKVNRNPSEILLVGVTKNVSIEKINMAIDLNINNLGENKAQELIQKQKYIINQNVNWHFIGTLQTNKVKNVIDKVNIIHSVDSFKLASEIDKRAKIINRTINILLQINIANEVSKHGIDPKYAIEFCENLEDLSNIKLLGLMTVAPFVENPQKNREYFKQMKKIFIDIASKNKDNINMKYLSMGMSNDYEVAIEEGSNIVRIGTALFGERDY